MVVKKVKSKYTEADFLLNPLERRLDNLSEFEGCCGIRILESFPSDANANSEIKDLVVEAADCQRYTEEYGGLPSELAPLTVESVRKELFGEAPLILATTIPSQKYAIKALTAIGFTPLETFKGTTGNRITLWSLRKG